MTARARAQDALNHGVQEIGDDRRTLGPVFGQDHARNQTFGRGDQITVCREQNHLQTLRQIQTAHRLACVVGLIGRQGGRACRGQAGLKHIGDQFSLTDERRGALPQHAVPPRIKVQNPSQQDKKPDQIEGDDFAGQRRAVQRNPAPFLALIKQRAVGLCGNDPIVAQYHNATTFLSGVPHMFILLRAQRVAAYSSL